MDRSYYRSEAIDKISAALSKAQGTYEKLMPDIRLARGDVASLTATYEAIRKSLSENALAIHQHIEVLDEGLGTSLLVTTLSHESGQHLGSVGRIVLDNDERRSSNIIEIHKRRHAQMLLGIAPIKNDLYALDDDGEKIAEERVIEIVRKGKIDPMPQQYKETISKEQLDELLIELDGYPELLQNIYECYNITTLADLPREEYHKARSKILKIKRTQEDYARRA